MKAINFMTLVMHNSLKENLGLVEYLQIIVN